MNEKFENFDELVNDIKTNNVMYFVNLRLAREFLNNIQNDKTTIIWSISFTIVIICLIIISIYSLGILWGIIYGLFITLLQFCYLAFCSMNLKINKPIFYISISVLCISFFLEWKLFLLLAVSSLSLISIYLFYEYIKRKIMNVALENEEIFNFLIKNNIIHF